MQFAALPLSAWGSTQKSVAALKELKINNGRRRIT